MPANLSFRDTFGPFALITGASDGIGQALAQECARRGLSLVLVARRADRLAALAHALSSDHGVDARPLAADLSNPSDVAKVAHTVENLEVGLFMPGAGFGTAGPFLKTDIADELSMIDVNCRAVVELTQPLARAMSVRGRGAIVFFSSIVAFQGVARAANYAATKAFIQTFAEGLRAELKGVGVKVLAAAPGPVETGFAARAGMHMAGAADPAGVARSIMRALASGGTTRPGLKAKVLGYSLSTLPRPLRIKVISQIMAGMTAGADVEKSLRPT
ncbi:MAG: SDR family NAD(P)-dependent oxidoreductase [Pseudomonadota bacterium]